MKFKISVVAFITLFLLITCCSSCFADSDFDYSLLPNQDDFYYPTLNFFDDYEYYCVLKESYPTGSIRYYFFFSHQPITFGYNSYHNINRFVPNVENPWDCYIMVFTNFNDNTDDFYASDKNSYAVNTGILSYSDFDSGVYNHDFYSDLSLVAANHAIYNCDNAEEELFVTPSEPSVPNNPNYSGCNLAFLSTIDLLDEDNIVSSAMSRFPYVCALNCNIELRDYMLGYGCSTIKIYFSDKPLSFDDDSFTYEDCYTNISDNEECLYIELYNWDRYNSCFFSSDKKTYKVTQTYSDNPLPGYFIFNDPRYEFIESNHTIYSSNDPSKVLFQVPLEVTATLTPIIQGITLTGVLREIIALLPIIIVVLVGLIGLRKALRFLRGIFQRS